MELDSNQEPLDQTCISMIGFDSVLDELESAHGHIEDRIRHLEAVIARARQRQRWRHSHTPIQITNSTAELTTANVQDEDRVHQEEVDITVEGGTVESGKRGKRKSTHLLAKALGMETKTNKAEGSTGNFFDCNICFGIARDPVLTCCGHLFCWPCFYQLSYVGTNAKECPVCEGEVTDSSIIPIYCNASVNSSCQSESRETSLGFPARPPARRVETIREQLIRRGAPPPTDLDIRRFSNYIDILQQRIQLGSRNAATDRTDAFVTQSRQETENNQPTSLQGAASFSSLLSSTSSSAMDSAERIVEDQDSYIHSHLIGRSRPINPHAVNRDPLLSTAATNQSESHTQDVVPTHFPATTSVSPSSGNDDITAVPDTEIQTADSGTEIISSDPSSSSSRIGDLIRRTANELRRRRAEYELRRRRFR